MPEQRRPKPLQLDVDRPAPTDEVPKMARKEKLVGLDRELRKLQAECVRSGYSATQVERFASSFFQASAKAKRERWAKLGIAVAGSVFLFLVLLQFNSPYRLTAAVARAGLVQVSLNLKPNMTSHCLLIVSKFSSTHEPRLSRCFFPTLLSTELCGAAYNHLT